MSNSRIAQLSDFSNGTIKVTDPATGTTSDNNNVPDDFTPHPHEGTGTVVSVSSDVSSGAEVTIEVDDATVFEQYDMAVIRDDNTEEEIEQIENVDTANNTVTVDNLKNSYQVADNAEIELLKVDWATVHVENPDEPEIISAYPMSGGPKAQSFFRLIMRKYPVGKLDKIIDDLGLNADKGLNKEPKIDAIIKERCMEMRSPYQGDGYTGALTSST